MTDGEGTRHRGERFISSGSSDISIVVVGGW